MKNAVTLVDEVDVSALDVIVFTNGIITSSQRAATPENLELDLAVSYLSRVAITSRLRSKGFGTGKRGHPERLPRVFVMGYPGGNIEATLDDFNSERSYGLVSAHMNTVVGNEALVTHLGRDLAGLANVYGLNPGIIRTEIRDRALGKNSWSSWAVEAIAGTFFPSAEQYAENVLVHALAAPELEDRPNTLIDSKGNLIVPNAFLLKPGNQQRVMAESLRLLEAAINTPVPSATTPA